MKFLLTTFVFMGIAISMQAQTDIQFNGSLKELLVMLQRKYGYKFMYSNDDINDQQKIEVGITSAETEESLAKMFKQIKIHCEIKNRQVTLKPEKPVDSEVLPPPSNPAASIDSVAILPDSRHPIEPITSLDPLKPLTPDFLHAYESKMASISRKSDDEEKTANQMAELDMVVHKSPRKVPVWAVHSNLLYDLALTPNMGIECRIGYASIIVNGYWAHIDWDAGNKTYRLWAVSPELRFYMPESKRFYAGAMFQKGELNLKLNQTGRQGYFIGGGLTLGYLANLGNRTKLDLSVGLGYVNYEYDSYQYIDRMNIRTGSDKTNWWGITKIGIIFVWIIN